MTLRGIVLGLAGLMAAAALPVAGATPSPRPVNTVYDLYLGGVKAGELTIDAEFSDDRYRAESVLRTAGIVGFVYKASFEAETEGVMSGAGLVPVRFAANSRMKKKRQYVEMTYEDRAPATVSAEPAFIPKPYQVDPTEQHGALDPISAALSALAPVAQQRMCSQSVEVFDGRRRYAIDLGAPEPDGARIRCPATYRRIAGFKPKMMKKRPSFPFDIWFTVRPDGLAHVVRAAGESMFGIAVILLRE